MELHLFICIFVFGILWYCEPVRGADNIREDSLRLVGATSNSAGRVEIYHDGIWGTVCDDGWGFYDAEVVCNQLGFPGAFSAVDYAYFGQGTGPIMLDDVNCKGYEHYLVDCRNDGWYDNNCHHGEDAGVLCNTPSDHYPRLINGYTYYEGRIEIWNGYQWTKLCTGSTFNETEGDTLCKELGYGGLDAFVDNDIFGEGSAPPATWGYSCSPNDESLSQCYRYSYTGHSCTAKALRCMNDDSLSGGAIAGIVIGVTMFFGLCVFSCVAVYKQSKARKSARRNTPEVAYASGATNTSGPTVQYVTSPSNQITPSNNVVVSNNVYYPPIAFNQQQPAQYGPVTQTNTPAFPPPPYPSSNVQQPNK